ncbi:MAG: oligosaccharide flippase family protein, partial [Rudaea sp.]
MKLPDLFRGRWTVEVAALLFFLALALVFFAPVLFGNATLLPLDNLYRFPPWQSYAASFGVGQPHNTLLDDLVLENYPWKKFILDSLKAGELPLWNPYIFAGQPFLAAGQSGALYPPGVIFLLLPLTLAYGVFAALHFWIAAASMYFLARVHGLRPLPAALSGVVYAFSGFMVVSVVFPMVISAAAWLSAILATLELTLREEERRRAGDRSFSQARQVLWLLVSAILIGLQFLAGHVEISYYILLVLGMYAAWRIIPALFAAGRFRERVARFARPAVLFAAALLLGAGLAAVQLVPLYELVQRNFRSGSVSYDQVAGWALPLRQVATFLIPDLFGNPAHHSYLDVFDLTIRTAPTGTIFWGIKNYVEAGSYVGILPLALALLAAIWAVATAVPRGRAALQVPLEANWASAKGEESSGGTGLRNKEGQFPGSRPGAVLFFVVLAILALLFAFGTPLYALLFYLLPGYNQLHTAFRWVFPYTLSVAFLAGVGLQLMTCADWKPILRRLIEWGLVIGGAAVIIGLALSLIWPAPFLRVADWVVAHDRAQAVFETGRVFWSYEFRPLLLFGLFAFLAGLVLRLARSRRLFAGRAPWRVLAIAVVVLDLFLAGIGFNPSADSRLLLFTPPAVRFLESDPTLFRIASYDKPDEKMFNANAGMYFGLSDIRGYDSIIPRQYVEFMSALAPQDELLYNRIAPFYNYEALSSPLLNLLNVKYVLSTRTVPNPGYRLVYDREIKIYENTRVLPRAFLVSRARVIQDRPALLDALKSLDPANEVLLEQEAPPVGSGEGTLPLPVVQKYSGSEVVLQTQAEQPAYLVLADSYFPGWVAQIDGQDTPIYRADGNFRAVVVPAGDHTLRFKYSPLSLKIGAFGSLVAAVIILLGLVALAWQRLTGLQLSGETGQVRTIARNSIVPMASSFITQGVNFLFALVMLRILGPENVGRYTFAVTVWLFASSITEFGLGILMTREVARDRSQANRYLTNTALLRTALTLLALIPLALFVGIYVAFFNLSADTVIAILLLWVSLFPVNLAASFSYLFNAHERFEYPTAVSLSTVLLSVVLQLAALLAGFGIVGLAAVSIISNTFTLVVLFHLVRAILFRPRWEPDRALLRWMFHESYPLMMNNLLSSLFFRIDVLLLKPLTSDTVLGYYSTAYRFINALNFIPSNFTLAIFPLLSRQAASARDAMLRALLVSLKLLLWVSIPITVASVFIARELILLFGGPAYLPDSQIALQWLIWFLPFSFVNSVVHYVLIALDQQRFLTKAFLIGLGFNIIANLIAIPLLSYRGAALVTVLSEVALLIPFYYSLRKHLAPLPVL